MWKRKNHIWQSQSEEGKGFGSWISASLSQQIGLPPPAFVQSISVPHSSQRYLFPSWLISITSSNIELNEHMNSKKLFLKFHGLTAAVKGSLTTASYNKFCSTFGTKISLSDKRCHSDLLLFNILTKSRSIPEISPPVIPVAISIFGPFSAVKISCPGTRFHFLSAYCLCSSLNDQELYRAWLHFLPYHL